MQLSLQVCHIQGINKLQARPLLMLYFYTNPRCNRTSLLYLLKTHMQITVIDKYKECLKLVPKCQEADSYN